MAIFVRTIAWNIATHKALPGPGSQKNFLNRVFGLYFTRFYPIFGVPEYRGTFPSAWRDGTSASTNHFRPHYRWKMERILVQNSSHQDGTSVSIRRGPSQRRSLPKGSIRERCVGFSFPIRSLFGSLILVFGARKYFEGCLSTI